MRQVRFRDPPVPSTTVAHHMALFRKTPKNPEELARVKLEIKKLREAIDRHEDRTRSVAESLAAQPDTVGLVGRVDAIDAALASRPDTEVAARLDAVVEQIDALDARITSVSTELANQLSELGNDIESLQSRPPGEPVSDEVLGGLRDSQERLANEQARYQIAFREDLAKLAEQLRRPGR